MSYMVELARNKGIMSVFLQRRKQTGILVGSGKTVETVIPKGQRTIGEPFTGDERLPALVKLPKAPKPLIKI